MPLSSVGLNPAPRSAAVPVLKLVAQLVEVPPNEP
jgi:hypothetical protein